MSSSSNETSSSFSINGMEDNVMGLEHNLLVKKKKKVKILSCKF